MPIDDADNEADGVHGNRLRLIVVYTAKSPVRRIAEQIVGSVPGFVFKVEGVPANPSLVSPDGRTKVVLLTKGGAVNDPAERLLSVDVPEPPQRVIEEFAKFAGGPLPNATIAAVGELRRNTRRMLSRLNRRLDGPLLSHRSLLMHSNDAEACVASLIHEEVQAQIPLAGKSEIAKFLDRNVAAGTP